MISSISTGINFCKQKRKNNKESDKNTIDNPRTILGYAGLTELFIDKLLKDVSHTLKKNKQINN